MLFTRFKLWLDFALIRWLASCFLRRGRQTQQVQTHVSLQVFLQKHLIALFCNPWDFPCGFISQRTSATLTGAISHLIKVNKRKIKWQCPLNAKMFGFFFSVPVYVPFIPNGLCCDCVPRLNVHRGEYVVFNPGFASDINAASWQDNRVAHSCFVL